MVRFSEYYINTAKEDSSSSEIPSYSLCLRASLIRKIASGIYSFLPLGNRVLKKIEKIVREEMDRAGAIELLMPVIQPADLWMQSERWYKYGAELFRLKDRNDREFCLGPTHEELITYLSHLDIKSYKDMPKNLYQIQVKFRDEIRPRYGILRAREFIMKDAYSFSGTENELDDIYKKMYKCYSNILERLNLKYFTVEADSGIIGGKFSHEFIILAANGEDELVYCPECGYAANFEMADFEYHRKNTTGNDKKNKMTSGIKEVEEIYTPNVTTIRSLTGMLKVSPEDILKTMVLKDHKNNLIAVLIRGDRELNLAKIEKYAGNKFYFIDKDEENRGLVIGYLGPVGLPPEIKVYADNSIIENKVFIAGANKKDHHIKNVNQPRDFKVDYWGDFSFPSEGDLCIKCGSILKYDKGIEVGHIFKLGTKYSEKMNALFLDAKGALKPIIMGCYGFGISRIIAASIEQLFDEKGIIWPISVAPFIVNLIAINIEDEKIAESAEEVYRRLQEEDIEVIFDDRPVRAGVKFKDSDLIGIPVKIILGKNYIEDKELELELRKDGTKLKMKTEEAIDFIKEYPKKNIF